MNNYTPTPDFYNDYIMHFNPFHDRNNGQFTSKNGEVSSGSKPMSKRELKKWYKNKDNDRPSNYLDKYQDEFDKSEEGKKLKKQYRDAWNLDLDKPSNAKKFDDAENNYLKKQQAYAVNKFYKNDSKKFRTEQIIFDQYPMTNRFKNASEEEVKNYLLNEQWKLHKA